MNEARKGEKEREKEKNVDGVKGSEGENVKKWGE